MNDCQPRALAFTHIASCSLHSQLYNTQLCNKKYKHPYNKKTQFCTWVNWHRCLTTCSKPHSQGLGAASKKSLLKFYHFIIKWDLIKNLKAFAQQENHKQNEKTTYGLGENICKQCNWQGLNFQNILTAHTTQWQRNKQPNEKMGRWPK